MIKIVKGIIVVLDNIRSRENVGSIFRTADAAGVSKIYLCGITPVPTRGIFVDTKMPLVDRISKTALGAETWVSWEYYRQTWRLLKKLKVQGLKLVALEQTKESVDVFNFRALDFSPLALVVGNEVKGLSPQILKHCDKKISIPMYGKKESLNVAVAFGVAVYQMLKTE